MENEGNNFQHWTAANIEFYSITSPYSDCRGDRVKGEAKPKMRRLDSPRSFLGTATASLVTKLAGLFIVHSTKLF